MTQLLMGCLRGARQAIKDIESGEYINYVNGEITPYPLQMLPIMASVTPANTPVPLTRNAKADITFKQLVERYNTSDEILERSEGVRIKDRTYQYLLLDILGETTDIADITKEVGR